METENLEEFANKVAVYLKNNGKFDEFRKKCASEIEQHVSWYHFSSSFRLLHNYFAPIYKL